MKTRIAVRADELRRGDTLDDDRVVTVVDTGKAKGSLVTITLVGDIDPTDSEVIEDWPSNPWHVTREIPNRLHH